MGHIENFEPTKEAVVRAGGLVATLRAGAERESSTARKAAGALASSSSEFTYPPSTMSMGF